MCGRCHYLVVMRLAFVSLLCVASVSGADAPRELREDFEGTKLASFWLPGNYGSGLHAAGAVEVSTNYARGGKRSLRVTVREGDVASPGGDGKTTERADLDSGHFPLLGKE